MEVDKFINSDIDFIIKDNILKGKEDPLSTEYINIGKLLLDKMKIKPDFVGQIDVITEETYTFAEMFDRTVKCALWLRQQGIKANDVVALCAPNIMDSFAPFFATFCVGAIFTPWNFAMDIREARYFMKLSGAKIVFADESSVSTILKAAKLDNNDIKVVVFGKASNALPFSKVLKGHSKSDIENFECAQNDIHDTAALLYSSGSTGLPKGVITSHFSLLYTLTIPNGLKVEEIPLCMSGYFWISGIILTLSCVVNYCKRLLYPTFEEEMTCKIIEKYKIAYDIDHKHCLIEQQIFWAPYDMQSLVQNCNTEKSVYRYLKVPLPVTCTFMTPSMMNRILKSGYFEKYDVSSVKKVNVGGTVLTKKNQIKLQECLSNSDVIQMYGMTEICGIITAQKPHHKAGSIGTIAANSQIKIIDLENGNAMGPNKTGELLIKSPTITKGYYNNPQATKDTIDVDGWLHTGDIAYYDENGELFIVDRLKETLKYRGFQISPSEIENLLQSHPDVVEVAVVGVPHPQDDEHPIAFITKVPGSKVSEREFQELVAKNMTDSYHLRGGVKFLEELPHTPSGKIAKKDLKTIAKSYQA